MSTSPHIGLQNKWHSILVHEGVPESILTGKQAPCPMCGGKDRFRFDDKGEGMWFCNHCGSGDGFGLLMGAHNLTFKEALDKARAVAGVVEAKIARYGSDDATKVRRMQAAWESGQRNTPALRAYFASRNIPTQYADDPMLRWHPSLPTDEGSAPCMLASYWNRDAKGIVQKCTLQRIWPSLKTKAVMPSPYKMAGIFCPLGGKPVGGRLGVAEGIETALSYRALKETAFPIWACYSADQMAKFVLPPNVEQLHICMDVDYSYTGQASAYALAKRLRNLHRELDIVLARPYPDDHAGDFNDRIRGGDHDK